MFIIYYRGIIYKYNPSGEYKCILYPGASQLEMANPLKISKIQNNNPCHRPKTSMQRPSKFTPSNEKIHQISNHSYDNGIESGSVKNRKFSRCLDNSRCLPSSVIIPQPLNQLPTGEDTETFTSLVKALSITSCSRKTQSNKSSLKQTTQKTKHSDALNSSFHNAKSEVKITDSVYSSSEMNNGSLAHINYGHPVPSTSSKRKSVLIRYGKSNDGIIHNN